MRKASLAQSAADTPLARWLVRVAESRGWKSGRQAALYLGVKQPAFSSWLRGEVEPDPLHQEQLARATGVPVAEIADLVWRTKSHKQRLTVGDLKRMDAAPEAAAAPQPGGLEAIEQRLERIERRMLTRTEMQEIIEEFMRRRIAGEPPTFLDDPPEQADDDRLRRAAG